MTTAPQSTSRTWTSLGVLALLALFLGGVLLQVGVGLWIDASWFAHLGYGQVWLLNRAAPWGLGLMVFSAVALWLGLNLRVAWPYPKRPWRALVVILSSGYVASVAMAHWFTFLVALFQQQVGTPDPILQHDISFYLFSLPLLLQLQKWGFWLGLFTFALVALCYGFRWRKLPGESQMVLARTAQRHLLGLGGILLLFQALGHWLARYTLMYSNRGSFAGANYTDVHTQMPVDILLAGMALVGAVALLSLALFNPELGYFKRVPRNSLEWHWRLRQMLGLLLILGTYGLAALGPGTDLPGPGTAGRRGTQRTGAGPPLH
jgi:uncharacterized membrane protein (UPF0182 family)